jgi:D-serine deaminase-like pyridoxal phosphate-dependent protein
MSGGELTRRSLIAGVGALAAATAAAVPVPAAIASGLAVDDSFPRSLGAGGSPTTNEGLAHLAREHGKGEPVMFVDLAAVDRNADVVAGFARAHGWRVRPALKVFQSPKLCAYILHRLPEPRGLVFHLRTVDQIMTAAPAGTDLLMGYPPTRGELQAYLTSTPPPGQRPHRLTLLASSLEILQDMARLARATPRRVPLDVGLEFDSGEGRGGFHHPQQISQAIKLLRRERRWLRLRAVLCYDGHATATGAESWRQYVAQQASGYFKAYLDQLYAEGGDLYDPAKLIRNGPGSANYRNWAGKPEINEISPGSAFVYAGYLRDGFDTQGLSRALTQAAPVLKDVGPYPSTLFTKIPIPPIIGEEYFLKGSTWPDQAGVQPPFVYPNGVQDDQREGGRCMVYAPPGELSTSDYVLCWPNQGGDGIDYFGALQVVRSGRIVDVWPTFTRWGTLAEGGARPTVTRRPPAQGLG